MYTSDMVHFFHEMLIYNPTCFDITATFKDNTFIIGRFSRPLHVVPNIKSKRTKYKNIGVIRDYRELKYLFKLSNKILKCNIYFIFHYFIEVFSRDISTILLSVIVSLHFIFYLFYLHFMFVLLCDGFENLPTY